jgi:hypothetical protein
MDIYLVIHETHNADTEVTPFVLDLDAFRFASQQVQDSFAGSGTIPDPREFEMELTQVMAAAGWMWYCRYHPEGDSVRVVKRELRGVETAPGFLPSSWMPSPEETAELAQTLANVTNLSRTPVKPFLYDVYDNLGQAGPYPVPSVRLPGTEPGEHVPVTGTWHSTAEDSASDEDEFAAWWDEAAELSKYEDIRQAARSTWMAARGWTGENG